MISFGMYDEATLARAIIENDNRANVRYMCFMPSDNTETDEMSIRCIEYCIFDFYQALDKSDLREREGERESYLHSHKLKVNVA